MPNINSPVNVTPQSRWETTVDEAVQSLHGHDADAKAPPQSTHQAVDAFSAFFRGQWSKTANELGSERLSGREGEKLGESALEDVVAASFGSGAGQGGPLAKKGDLRRAVVTANILANEKLMGVREQYGQTQPLQVVPFRFNGGNEIRFSIIKDAPKIENLVLRGGGAKGGGYPPTLVELESHGLLAGVDHVVGTSAGALTAAVLAAGLNAKQFQDLSDATPMSGMKDTPHNWDAKYPNLKFHHVGFQAGVALEVVDRASASSVKAFLDSADGQAKLAAAVREGRVSVDGANALKALQHQNFDVDRTPQMVTFGDLENLSKVDPGKFKSLTLTGWNTTDEKLAYFDSANTPKMPIAVAARISMSIPLFFASMKYDAGQGEKSWVDGGVGSNMPSGAIFDGLENGLKRAVANLDVPGITSNAKELMDARSRTLLLTFDEGGEAYKILNGPPEERDASGGKMSKIEGFFAHNPNYGAATARDKERVYDGGPNSLVVFHGDMGTLSLSADQGQKDAASLGARMRTVEQIAQRQNQATYDVFTDPASGAKSLSAEQRALFLQAGSPNPQSFANGDGVVDEGLLQAATKFYEEVAKLNAGS